MLAKLNIRSCGGHNNPPNSSSTAIFFMRSPGLPFFQFLIPSSPLDEPVHVVGPLDLVALLLVLLGRLGDGHALAGGGGGAAGHGGGLVAVVHQVAEGAVAAAAPLAGGGGRPRDAPGGVAFALLPPPGAAGLGVGALKDVG